MIRVFADRAVCEGHANCVMTCPEIYTLDQDGKVELLMTDAPDRLRALVEAAVEGCPVHALSAVYADEA